MNTLFKVALATIVMAGMSGVARADLNFNGEVGLPINPTAQIPEAGGARVQGNYYDLGSGSDFYSIAGAVRASRTSPIEINGAINYVDATGDSDTGFSIGAKYLFTREAVSGVRVAAGAGYTNFSQVDNLRAYVVASKSFGKVVDGRANTVGHLGLRYDNFDTSSVLGDSDKVSVFAGAEVPVTRDGALQVVGEIGSRTLDGGDSPYSLSLRYRPIQRPFGASIGVQRLGFASDNARLFVQVGYTFGR